MRILSFALFLVLTGCSTFQKIAVRSSAPLFQASSERMTQERSWEFLKESTPSNLKLIEMLYLQDKDNLPLLGLLVKGYFGYSYAVPETLALDDELSGVENSHWKKEAILLHTRALDYGLEYFQKKDITRNDLLSLDESELKKKLDKKLKKEDQQAALYFAQAWGSLINLQKDNVALVSQVPKVKALFDWVCGKDSSIEHGVCDIFYAQYEASRPRMLGGNPEKAAELYKAAIEKHPLHLLIRLGRIQYLILPAFEKDQYEKEAHVLQAEFQKWEDVNRDTLEDKSEYKVVEDLNLFNAVAKKRFDIIQKHKSKIFEG